MAFNGIRKGLGLLKKLPEFIKKTEKISEPMQSVAKTTNDKRDGIVKTIQNQDHKRTTKTNGSNEIINNSNNSLVDTATDIATTAAANEIPKKNFLRKALEGAKDLGSKAITKAKPVIKAGGKLAGGVYAASGIYNGTKSAIQTYNDDYSHLDVDEKTKNNFRIGESIGSFLNGASGQLFYNNDDTYRRRTTGLAIQHFLGLRNGPKKAKEIDYKQSTEDLKKQLERHERIRKGGKASKDKLSLIAKQDEFIRKQLALREKGLDDSKIASERLASTNDYFKKIEEKRKNNEDLKDIHLKEDPHKIKQNNTKREAVEIQEESPTIDYGYGTESSNYIKNGYGLNRSRNNYSNNQINGNSAFGNYQGEIGIEQNQTSSLNQTTQNIQHNFQTKKELEKVDRTGQNYLNPETKIKRKYTQEEIDAVKDPYEKAKMIEENQLIDKLVEQDIKRGNIEGAITRRQADSLIDHSTSGIRSIAVQTENELNKAKLDMEKYENEKNRQHDFDKMSLGHTFDLEKMEKNHQYDVDMLGRKHYYEVDIMGRKHYLDLEKMGVQHQYNLEQDYIRSQNEFALKGLGGEGSSYVSDSLISEAVESWNNGKSSAEIMKELNEVDKTGKSSMAFSEVISGQRRDQFSSDPTKEREYQEIVDKRRWVVDKIMNSNGLGEGGISGFLSNPYKRFTGDNQQLLNHLSFVIAKGNQIELALNSPLLKGQTSDKDVAFMTATNKFKQYVQMDGDRVIGLNIGNGSHEDRAGVIDAYLDIINKLTHVSGFDNYKERQNKELEERSKKYQ